MGTKNETADLTPRATLLEQAAPTKRKPRTKEERAAELLAEAKRDKAAKTARLQLDLIRSCLSRKDWSQAIEEYGVLGVQLDVLVGDIGAGEVDGG